MVYLLRPLFNLLLSSITEFEAKDGISGPNFIENQNHSAYLKLGETGLEITTKVKPKAVVVFSAHWQDGRSRVSINAAEDAELIYDFYRFPPALLRIQISEQVAQKLSGAGIQVVKVKRGLHHGYGLGGCSIPLSQQFIRNVLNSTALDPEHNPLNVPIIQVSLFNNEDSGLHYHMGQALEGLPDEGILIIGAEWLLIICGITGLCEVVLSPYRRYAISFDDALKAAVSSEPESCKVAISALMRRSDASQAHPTVEHILLIHVIAGADVSERLWTMPEGPLNWALYRFGKV
ncbi:hypothetical protein RRF57_011085 [Xylaria bambusicola]|uniref:Extradiol ring-cleavage dioxygenase class III enzyme subunit B domain-containing protein n=1 Tax=Xylaria bambusicola TaxID=326684 RepID=A0AAN7UXJ9_9PEZI